MLMNISPGAEIDDRDMLDSLMDYIESDPNFNYMRTDKGSLTVLSFCNDKLTLRQEGACGGCSVLKIAATKRRVMDRITEMFAQVEVEFAAPPAIAPHSAPSPL